MAKQIILTQNNFGIPIELQFVSNTNSPIDLTDKTVEVAISYDGTIIDVLQATISSYTNGTAYIIVNTKHTSNVGLYTTFWSVRDKYGYITAQEDLYYYVKGEYNGAETPGMEQDKVTIEEKFDEINSYLDEFGSQLDNKMSKEEIKKVQTKLTNDIETINSQMDTIATGIYVPISLLNGVRGIENFLRTNNSKKIIFPFSREIILDKALVIDFSANIDFNYCIFTVPNNITNWETRYTETDYSIKYTMINFLNTENISFENLFLNGNGDNVDVDNLIGLTVKGVTNLKADNIHLTNFKYHHLYIAHETKNIVINNLNLKKLGSTFGSSYIYIRNNEDDDIIFNNLSVINDSMDDSGTGQVVYNAGYNVFIYNVKCKNIDCFLDVRKGDCVCDDVIIDECNTVFNIQPYPSALGTVGTLVLKNLIAKNLNGLQTTDTSVGVYGCEKLILENIELNYKNNAYGSHGIKIYKQNAETPLRNLYFKNIVINNATANGIAFMNKSMQSNINISVLENITILTNVSESSKNGACGIRVYDNTIGIIDIKNLIEDGYTYDCRDESEIVSLDIKLKNIGTTAERPSFKMGSRSVLKGFRYFDTTLKKEIIWSGSNSDGWIIPN